MKLDIFSSYSEVERQKMQAIAIPVDAVLLSCDWLEEPVTRHRKIPLGVEDGDRNMIQLVQPFTFTATFKVDRKIGHISITIPEGFVWDGGSSPSFSWSITKITPFDPENLPSFLIHDFCYCLAAMGVMTRLQADELLKDAMITNWFVRRVFYYGVRFGGAQHVGIDAENIPNLRKWLNSEPDGVPLMSFTA